MNKFAAYAGYAVARVFDYAHRNFFKLAFLAAVVSIALDVSTLVGYTKLIGMRFYEFTSWYHNMFAGKSIT